MTTWVLVIYMGITWAGVGAVRSIEYPSEDSCYRALDQMMVAQTNIVAGENSKQMIALCKPSDNTEDKQMPELARAVMNSTRRVWVGYLDDAMANKEVLFGYLSGETIERKIMDKWYRDGFIMPAFKAGDELRIKTEDK